MKKKLLLIVNPVSGMRLGMLYLQKINEILQSGGYEVFTMLTSKRGDAENWAEIYGEYFDVITAVGGDGTFNEVVSGNIKGANRLLGYIPCGSTNDFAASLGLKTDIQKAAESIATGTVHTVDAGEFSDRIFTYVASFGAFTKASYSTSQKAKNVFGHLAYLLESGLELTSLKPETVTFKTRDTIHSGKYIFGAVLNSTSIGGVINFDKERVNLNDGKFEVILIKNLENPVDVSKAIYALTSQNLESSDKIEFFETDILEVVDNPSGGWSLDGEYCEGKNNSVIENLYSAIKIIF